MDNSDIQYAIRLLNVKFISVNYKAKNLFDKRISSEMSVDVQYKLRFNDKQPKNYLVDFTIKVTDKNDEVSLSLQAIALFKTNQTIDEDFKKSSFANQNSPAIAFPYIRSFISTLTVNAGLDPIILPAFNFAKIKK